MDSGLRRNDEKTKISTFYGFINPDGSIKKATFYNRSSWLHDTPFSGWN